MAFLSYEFGKFMWPYSATLVCASVLRMSCARHSGKHLRHQSASSNSRSHVVEKSRRRAHVRKGGSMGRDARGNGEAGRRAESARAKTVL